MNKILYTTGIFMILFMILSPGFIINIPPHKNKFKSKYIFTTGVSTLSSVFVHSLIFALCAYFILTKYTLVTPTINEAASIINEAATTSFVPLVNQLSTPLGTN